MGRAQESFGTTKRSYMYTYRREVLGRRDRSNRERGAAGGKAHMQGGSGFGRTLPLGHKGPLNETKKNDNQHTFREWSVLQPLCFYRQKALSCRIWLHMFKLFLGEHAHGPPKRGWALLGGTALPPSFAQGHFGPSEKKKKKKEPTPLDSCVRLLRPRDKAGQRWPTRLQTIVTFFSSEWIFTKKASTFRIKKAHSILFLQTRRKNDVNAHTTAQGHFGPSEKKERTHPSGLLRTASEQPQKFRGSGYLAVVQPDLEHAATATIPFIVSDPNDLADITLIVK